MEGANNIPISIEMVNGGLPNLSKTLDNSQDSIYCTHGLKVKTLDNSLDSFYLHTSLKVNIYQNYVNNGSILLYIHNKMLQ